MYVYIEWKLKMQAIEWKKIRSDCLRAYEELPSEVDQKNKTPLYRDFRVGSA